MKAQNQTLEHLAMANEVRLGCAAICRELAELKPRESRHRAADLLRRPDEIVARMRVGKLLDSIHRFGPNRTEQALRQAGLPVAARERRVGPLKNARPLRNERALTARQRLEIVDVLLNGRIQCR